MVKLSDDHLNAVFGALADPTRRAMVTRLSRGPARVTELAEPFDMSLPAVSKHLRVLENAGMVSRDKQGRAHNMKLEAAPMKSAVEWIEQYRQFWEGSLDSLAQYLDDTNPKKKKGPA